MTVTVSIEGGPQIVVPWKAGMSAQDAIELAQQQTSNASFTYAIQYYGLELGYLVLMINETYDSFISAAAPFFYWEFLLNDQWSPTGIDSTQLNDNDVVTFRFTSYDAATHAGTPLAAKHKLRGAGASAG